MKVELIVGWQISLGFAISKEGFMLMFPIVMIMVDWTHYRRFTFNFEKHF